jgi:predicted small metal-binding protein
MADDDREYEPQCSDFRVDCDFTVRADTEEEIVDRCLEHACTAHGKCDASLGKMEKIRSRIRSVF